MATPRFRVHQWVDLTHRVRLFGVQERVAPRKWIHCTWGRSPILYSDRGIAQLAVEELSLGCSIGHLPRYEPPPPVIEPDPCGTEAQRMDRDSQPL